MDYMLTVVIFALFCNRITCVPLINEVQGTNSGPLPPNPKDNKAASTGASTISKSVPKLAPVSNNFMSALNNMLTKPQRSASKAGAGLGILDNPLIAQQLNALLGSKPVKSDMFSTFANPVFAAQLNKMFNTMPLGSMSSMKFLNNPSMGKQKGGPQALSKVSFFNKNIPMQNKVQMQNMLDANSGKQANQLSPSETLVAPAPAKSSASAPKLLALPPKLPSSPPQLPSSPPQLPSSQPNSPAPNPQLPSPPSKLSSSQITLPQAPTKHKVSPAALPGSSKATAIQSANEIDALLLEAGMTDPMHKLGEKQGSNIAELQGMHKHPHAPFDEAALSGLDMFDSLSKNTDMITGTGNVQAGSNLSTNLELNMKNEGAPPQMSQGPGQEFGQVSEQGLASHRDPLQETIVGASLGEVYKPPSKPHDIIGTVLKEMSQMVHNQSPLGGSTTDWKTSPVDTSFSSGVMPMKGDKVPIGMSWLNAGSVERTKTIGSAEPSLMQNWDVKPKFGEAGQKSEKPVTTWRLKTDLGTLVGETGSNYIEKKPVPKKTVCKKKDLYAICNLAGNPSKPIFKNITGTLYLRQKITKKCEYDWLNIQVDIDNVPMKDGTLFHGMHIHEFGEMTNGCEGMGSHYNPTNTPHGAPWQPERLRHVGDLGNVRQRRRDGKIYTRIIDYVAQLEGPQSIIGRGIALKTGRDDLGQGKGDSSKVTGNSGDMMACCVVSRSRPHSDDLYTLY